MLGSVWAFLFGLLVIVGLAGDFPVFVALGGMGLLVACGAWLWSRLATDELVFLRTLSQERAFAGDEIILSVTLTNRKPLPLAWVRLFDSLPPGLEILDRSVEWDPKEMVQSMVHRTSLGSYERVRWVYRVRCVKRGLFQLGPASLHTGDPFGFFPRRIDLPQQESILVYPKTIPLPNLFVPARWPVGDRRSVLPLNSDPLRPAGIRSYQSGDPMKSIDWKATARRMALQVKIYEPGASVVAVPVVNVDTVGVSYGGSIPHHLERVVSVAASLTQEALSHGLNVGLITNGKSSLYDHPMSVSPGRSRYQLDLIFEALAMVSAYVGSAIEEQLLLASRRLPRGTSLILITGIVTVGLRQALQVLLREGKAPSVIWVADFEPQGIPVGIECQNLAEYLALCERDDASLN